MIKSEFDNIIQKKQNNTDFDKNTFFKIYFAEIKYFWIYSTKNLQFLISRACRIASMLRLVPITLPNIVPAVMPIIIPNK